MTREQRVCEMNEAIIVAKRVLNSLQSVEKSLESAGNWGLWDVFGGGLLASFFKHSKLEDAETEMERAKQEIRLLQKELKDIDIPMEFQMKVEGFLVFADFFFDGLVADWLVQEKIKEARAQVKEAKEMVGIVLTDLKRCEKQVLLEEEM